MRTSSAILLAALLLASAAPAWAQGFKFPDPNAPAAPDAQRLEREAKVRAQLATPCAQRIKDRKIMVLIAEERGGAIVANQSGYSRHIDAINRRLGWLGLKTYTPEQIRRQVAQAEIDAHFRNDPDAALSAARRLAAQYTLRGLISTNAQRNAIIPVNQVSVSMEFTLVGANGRPVSQTGVRDQSYAGADVAGMALTLIEERADEVVAQLYSDYCQNTPTR